jgi:hypothetical protein
MRVLRRLASLLVLAGATSGGLLAQTSWVAGGGLRDETGAWPSSVDARMVAWEAHDAVAQGDGSKIPEFLNLAKQWAAPAQPQTGRAQIDPVSESDGTRRTAQVAERRDREDAMAAVLDALIEMQVAVPAQTLRGLAPEFGNYVAVLLTRMPEGEREALGFEFYLGQAENGSGLQYVSAALLAQRPVQGFVADLISNVEVRATVDVVLPGGLTGGSGRSGCGSGFGGSDKSSWPMIGQYQLSDKREDGDILLVDGNVPVYASRFEAPQYIGAPSTVYLGPEERMGFVAEMLGISAAEIPWKTWVTTTIEFESNQQVERALRDFVEQQREMQRDTVAALETHGLLTAAEAKTALPQLELTVNDMRGEEAEGAAEADQWESPPGVKLTSQKF